MGATTLSRRTLLQTDYPQRLTFSKLYHNRPLTGPAVSVIGCKRGNAVPSPPIYAQMVLHLKLLQRKEKAHDH